eukprot:320964-Pyramimonas_sp.AAC.1
MAAIRRAVLTLSTCNPAHAEPDRLADISANPRTADVVGLIGTSIRRQRTGLHTKAFTRHYHAIEWGWDTSPYANKSCGVTLLSK